MRLHYLLEENIIFESLGFATKILQVYFGFVNNALQLILLFMYHQHDQKHDDIDNIPPFLIGWTNLFVFSDFSSTSPTWLNSITSCSSSWITTSTVRDDDSFIFWSICQGIFACICKITWIVFLHICLCESIHISISPESLG